MQRKNLRLYDPDLSDLVDRRDRSNGPHSEIEPFEPFMQQQHHDTHLIPVLKLPSQSQVNTSTASGENPALPGYPTLIKKFYDGLIGG